MAEILKDYVLPGLVYAIIYSIGLVYGLIFTVRCLYKVFKDKSLDCFKVKNREIPPKCLNDPELGTHAYVQIKNVKIHYVENGDKNKPLMLFLHGFPECWYSWRYQMKEFSKDYWTVAIDMRGYGDSEKPDGYRYYRMKYLIEDVKNIIEGLGREKCTLVATDWGGLVGWYFLQIYPQYIESYILLNSGHPVIIRKLMISQYSQFKKSWYVFFMQLPYLPELFFRMKDMHLFNKIYGTTKNISEEDMEALKFIFGKPGAFTPPLNYYRANMTADHELLKKRKDNFSLPRGLFLFGEKDDFIDIEVVEKTKRLVYNLTTEIIKGSSHFVQQDEYQIVNKHMREFLKNGYEPEAKSEKVAQDE